MSDERPVSEPRDDRLEAALAEIRAWRIAHPTETYSRSLDAIVSLDQLPTDDY